MNLPISTDEIRRFTPPSLVALAAANPEKPAPVFLIKVPSWRHRIAIRNLVEREGYSYPGDGDMARALRAAVTEHVAEHDHGRLFDVLDEFEAVADGGILSAELVEQVSQMVMTLKRVHPPVAGIVADRDSYLQAAGMARVKILLCGIEGEGVPAFKRVMGEVTDATLDAISKQYGDAALRELGTEVLSLILPSKDDEGNSASPRPLPPAPATSQAVKPRRTARRGKSSGSATSATPG